MPHALSLPAGKYALLSISDNGTGIPSAHLNKIFEPYFTTKEKGRGTGLGLSVAFGLVKKYHGDIKVDSQVGKGTTFDVYLPLMEKSRIEIPNLEDTAISPIGSEKILLVDDEISIVKLETIMLEGLGYQVTPCVNSEDAFKMFEAAPFDFDLVISDMTMPNMTGDQLSKKIMDIRPDIPIIICTGYSEKMSREQAETSGIKAYLMKPLKISDMAQAVRNVLDGTKP